MDDDFVDFGLWLAEEITGRTMTRIDLESCLADWKKSRTMTDCLRDRIIATIQGVDDWRGVTDPAILADALIEKLKLVPEYSEGDDDGRTLWDHPDDTPYNLSPSKIQTRYVTSWEFPQ